MGYKIFYGKLMIVWDGFRFDIENLAFAIEQLTVISRKKKSPSQRLLEATPRATVQDCTFK